MLRPLLTALLVVLLSCKPLNSPKESTRTKDNSASIAQMQKNIKELEKKLAQAQAQEKEVAQTTNNSEELTEIKLDIQRLRAEIQVELNRIESEINARLAQYETRYQNLVQLIEDQENKFVSIKEFQKAKNKIQRELQTKEYYQQMRKNQKALTSEEIDLIKLQIAQLKARQDELETGFTQSLATATAKWEQELQKKILENNNTLNDEINKFIEAELVRIYTSNEALKNKITVLEEQVSAYQKDTSTQKLVQALQAQVTVLTEQVKINQELIQEIKTQSENVLVQAPVQTTSPLSNSIVDDIIKKLYAPCTTGGLKSDNFCYSVGTVINRLGGKFLDPKKFPRTKRGLLRYLIQSGVTMDAATKNMDYYINPSTSNREIFNQCHPNNELEGLIAPNKYWPRLIILSLVFQGIEKNIEIEKSMGLVNNNVKPINYFVAWWRSQCYSDGLYNRTQTHGDHLFAAALDVGFSDQGNKETFNYYREYIKTNIWEKDIYEIVYPLVNSGLNISIGVGMGHGTHQKGKLHLGIYSEISVPSENRRQWSYGNYTELF